MVHKLWFALIIILLSFSCKGQKVETDFAELSATITFIRGQVAINGKLARVGDKVASSNIIKVGIPGTVVLQFKEIAAITLREGTELSIEEFLSVEDNAPRILLNQKSGNSFSKIVKKGADFQIRTPSVTAGVRGTSFDLSVDPENENKTVIRLLKGKLALTKSEQQGSKSEQQGTKEEKKIELNAGERYTESEDEEPVTETMNEEEVAVLEKADTVEIIKEEEIENTEILKKKKVIPQAALEVTELKLQEVTPETVDEPESKVTKKKKTRVTLKDLRKKYGSVVRITTKDGKSYEGAFEQKTGFHIIHTISGDVKIKSDTIAKIIPLR
jgi:hypothetical protein